MNCKLLIPYDSITSNFDYMGELDSETYMKMLNMAMNGDDITHMLNNEQSQRLNVSTTDTSIAVTCSLTNLDGQMENVQSLSNYTLSNEMVGMIVEIVEEIKNVDIDTEMRLWVKDSERILNHPKLDDDTKFNHLPPRNFKVNIDGQIFSLNDCVIIDIYNTYKFAFIANSVK